MGEVGALALLQALYHNHTLQHLTPTNSGAGAALSDALERLLARNRGEDTSSSGGGGGGGLQRRSGSISSRGSTDTTVSTLRPASAHSSGSGDTLGPVDTLHAAGAASDGHAPSPSLLLL